MGKRKGQDSHDFCKNQETSVWKRNLFTIKYKVDKKGYFLLSWKRDLESKYGFHDFKDAYIQSRFLQLLPTPRKELQLLHKRTISCGIWISSKPGCLNLLKMLWNWKTRSVERFWRVEGTHRTANIKVQC